MWASLSLVAQVCIVGTYARGAHTNKFRWNHWANAIGCIPIIVVEALTSPTLIPLTAAFGVVGWYGVIRRPSE